VLLAEDDRVNQLVASRMLEKRGHAVTIARDGRQALAELARAEFDIVLMDVHARNGWARSHGGNTSG
jgi:two-component system, sensor histidine kinase and response regulator